MVVTQSGCQKCVGGDGNYLAVGADEIYDTLKVQCVEFWGDLILEYVRLVCN